jgi:hypothetical protein
MTTTTIKSLKESIIEYVDYLVKSNTTSNAIYENMANDVYANQIQPFVKNEAITTWEADIQKRFLNNPYCKFQISEKQAYCLARAFAQINSETISA